MGGRWRGGYVEEVWAATLQQIREIYYIVHNTYSFQMSIVVKTIHLLFSKATCIKGVE